MSRPDTTPPETPSTDADERAPNTILNGVIGGVVAVVLSFIPLSPILGGAVAGYLEGGDQRDGLVVGTIAGVIALIPFVLFGMLAAVILIAPGAVRLVPLLAVFLFFVAIYTVGLSALGGIVGIYVEDEFDL
ncbi:DUF5518 domain-containing protein [Natronomonas halophila]|uniref:DUF5518 domain-containing protein n=1 Tax=Natronomonas halophila TaxID=2747817 RepID=UPI0015B72CD4|nr:DUF5518 domain-containing protein [Natronomonas halophila]QLD85415.1 DUF5518 domain-containing protein [Natronomonas halophila]